MTHLKQAREVLLRIECTVGQTFQPSLLRDLIQNIIASALIDARLAQLKEDGASTTRVLHSLFDPPSPLPHTPSPHPPINHES